MSERVRWQNGNILEVGDSDVNGECVAAAELEVTLDAVGSLPGEVHQCSSMRICELFG